MMRRFLHWLTDRLPTREIDHEGRFFLERHYGWTLMPPARLAHRAYLHHFIDSDPDGLHNHPFAWSFSIPLAGWYYEDRTTGRRVVRWFNWIGPDTLHRVIVPKGMTVWTLFVHGPRVKPWGILRRGLGFDRYVIKGRSMPYYALVIDTEDHEPAFGDWWKTAPSGAEIRRRQRMRALARRSHLLIKVETTYGVDPGAEVRAAPMPAVFRHRRRVRFDFTDASLERITQEQIDRAKQDMRRALKP